MKRRLFSAFLAAALTLCAVPLPRAAALGPAPLAEVLIEPSLVTDTLYGFEGGSAIVFSQGRGYELVDRDGKTLTGRPYDLIRPRSSDLYVARRDGKYGALSLAGREILPFTYDALTDFVDGYAVSVRLGIRRTVNLAGDLSTPLEFDEVQLLPGGLLRVRSGKLYGLAEISGTLLAEPVYSELGDFRDGRSVVWRDGLCGFIDTSGREVLPPTAEYYITQHFQDRVLIAQKDGMSGLLGLDGRPLTGFEYTSMARHETGILAKKRGGACFFVDYKGQTTALPYAPERYFGNGLWIFRDESLFGVMDSTGNAVLPAEYSLIQPYDGSLARVEKGSLQGCLDQDANIVIPVIYETLSLRKGEVVAGRGGKAGVLDCAGNTVLPFQYPDVGPLSDGMRAFQDEGGLWGYLNADGEPVIPCRYTHADVFVDGLAVVSDAPDRAPNKIIDRTGRVAAQGVPRPDSNLGNRLFATCDPSKTPGSLFGVTDSSGKLLLPHAYSFVQRTRRALDFYLVCGGSERGSLDGLWGVMDNSGKLILPAEYEKIVPCDPLPEGYGSSYRMADLVSELNGDGDGGNLSGLYWMRKNGKWGLVRFTPRADIPTDWAKAHVERAAAAGIVPQTLLSNYSAPATRAEFCALAVTLYERVKGSEIPVRVRFTDTDDVNVEKMAGLNVVAGVGGSKFAPDDPITREQAAMILSKLLDALTTHKTASGGSSGLFTDMDSVSDWARGAVVRMRSLGIMSGVGHGNFGPKGSYTREQCITTLLKLYDMAAQAA